ncbi:acetyl-CoA carboxylase biotin carboxyl carrier protein subunit [Pseudonocardia sp. DSM 110487]|nr:acetyl-CoA carboxylase biotin carboxyl carrier protein subunit [Pseudonocardia sp. DSM 110487]
MCGRCGERWGGRAALDGRQLLAEVPGTVLAIAGEVGGEVVPGSVVMVLESMKMEIPVLSDVHGVISRMLVDVGEPVRANAPVVEIRSVPAGADR